VSEVASDTVQPATARTAAHARVVRVSVEGFQHGSNEPLPVEPLACQLPVVVTLSVSDRT
jgi:hypothetical protein